MMEGNRRHWSREPYVWLLIAFPAAAVIAGIITFILAIRSEDGLVVDDYYKRGLEINRTLDRDLLAQQYALDAKLNLPDGDSRLIVELYSNVDFIPPQTLKINLLHATRKGFDQVFLVSRTDGNRYVTPVRKLKPGRWHVLMETDEWRLVKVIRIN